MVRIAAEECVRSIDMFGWDAIRWDGHPRGAGWTQTGRSGKYRQWAARQTQALVRYFKEIVARKHPDFRHRYNYLLIEAALGGEGRRVASTLAAQLATVTNLPRRVRLRIVDFLRDERPANAADLAWKALQEAKRPDLADFAAARLGEPK